MARHRISECGLAGVAALMLAALMLAACGPAARGGDEPAPAEASGGAASGAAAASAATSAQGGSASAAASAAAAGGNAVAEANDDYQFEYAYPAAAAATPPLAAELDQRRAAALAALKQESSAARAEAEASGFDYRPHSLEVEWQQAVNLPAYLSLSATIASYGGGAHGNVGFDALIWDRAASRARRPLTLFASAAAFDRAVSPAFCRLLDRERVRRRGAPVSADRSGTFEDCIAASEQTLVLGSASGAGFDRMTILIGPYAAGPYAEGVYEINLPVTAAVLDAVAPEFRAAFRLGQ